MTDTEIRMAIAEACTLNDLNAMHKVEKTLSGEQWSLYFEELQALSRNEETIKNWREINPSYLADCFAVHSTARQRAEAFLRVKAVLNNSI